MTEKLFEYEKLKYKMMPREDLWFTTYVEFANKIDGKNLRIAKT